MDPKTWDKIYDAVSSAVSKLHPAQIPPVVLAPAVGAGVGGLGGAVLSDDGAELRGALQGATLGGLMGAGTGLGAVALQKLMPTANQAALIGGALGGGLGGVIGQRRISPWVGDLLKQEATDKILQERELRAQLAQEELMQRQAAGLGGIKMGAQNEQAMNKQAMEKEAAERMDAFEHGLNVWLQEKGIEKEAFAVACGVTPAEFVPAARLWYEETVTALAAQQNG